MELNYTEIGKRIARRRKELGLKQSVVCERAEINDKYLSCIERATPDEFFTGGIRNKSDRWRDVAELLRKMNPTKMKLAQSFLTWLSAQEIPQRP